MSSTNTFFSNDMDIWIVVTVSAVALAIIAGLVYTRWYRKQSLYDKVVGKAKLAWKNIQTTFKELPLWAKVASGIALLLLIVGLGYYLGPLGQRAVSDKVGPITLDNVDANVVVAEVERPWFALY